MADLFLDSADKELILLLFCMARSSLAEIEEPLPPNSGVLESRGSGEYALAVEGHVSAVDPALVLHFVR